MRQVIQPHLSIRIVCRYRPFSKENSSNYGRGLAKTIEEKILFEMIIRNYNQLYNYDLTAVLVFAKEEVSVSVGCVHLG